MSKYVTDEMVEKGAAGARAWGVKSSHGDWSDEETQRNCARDILEVAAPLIAAEALRDAVASGEAVFETRPPKNIYVYPLCIPTNTPTTKEI